MPDIAEKNTKYATTRLVNCRTHPYDVFIGRPSKWGNPFKIGVHGDRAEVIQKYRDWILTKSLLLKQIVELENKILGCYCPPLSCHGEVLLDLINNKVPKGDENGDTKDICESSRYDRNPDN